MTRLAILWHMHQPYYEDLATGEHILPWVRLHATKDYWGMVALLREFPGVRVTFNLVPSLLVQVEAFADDRAHDRHLLVGLMEADRLDPSDRDFLVANAFHAPFERMIRPYPRYAELHARRTTPTTFTTDELRDLQVLQKLAWLDPDWLATDQRLTALVTKGRGYSESDKHALRGIELELLNAVIPAYREAAASGQVELSTSPFYHPILPLLCNTDVHLRAHPHSPLPRQVFARPGDATEQLRRAFDYHRAVFGAAPRGVWPSEGSLSDEVADILTAHGCEWTATDEEILARSLGRRLEPGDLYRPYTIGANGALRCLFRDHQLSDLIGFTYQSWAADEAVTDLLTKVRRAGGDDGTVTVVLDGENAWEHYADGGRPFLRALYQRLQDAPDIQTVTMSEAAASPTPTPAMLSSMFPGSWINGDFYIWAGHADDHRAWRQLADARATFDRFETTADPAARARAWQELLIAEGSDWFWWYGDDHSSDHDREFDDLFRRHLRNVYRALGQPIPDELWATNITTGLPTQGPLEIPWLLDVSVDGRCDSFLKWAGALNIPTAGRSGSMHRVAGQLVRSIWMTCSLDTVFIRVAGAELVRRLTNAELVVSVQLEKPNLMRLELHRNALAGPRWSVRDAVELGVPFEAVGIKPGDLAVLSILILSRSGDVLEKHPSDGPIEFRVPTASGLTTRWLV